MARFGLATQTGHDEPPLSPAAREYLAAFDRYLAAPRGSFSEAVHRDKMARIADRWRTGGVHAPGRGRRAA